MSHSTCQISLDTGQESLPLLVYRLVNNSLFEVRPDLHQSLFQLRHVTYWLLVYVLLHAAPNQGSRRGLRSGLLGAHNFGEIKSCVS